MIEKTLTNLQFFLLVQLKVAREKVQETFCSSTQVFHSLVQQLVKAHKLSITYELEERHFACLN